MLNYCDLSFGYGFDMLPSVTNMCGTAFFVCGCASFVMGVGVAFNFLNLTSTEIVCPIGCNQF